MKYEELLFHRDELLQTAKLANLAYAHQWLADFAGRVASAGLRGKVVLFGPNEEESRRRPLLVALDFSQAVVDEHFLAEEIKELHAVLSFVHDAEQLMEARFELSEIGRLYVPALDRVLQLSGILPQKRTPGAGSPNLDAA